MRNLVVTLLLVMLTATFAQVVHAAPGPPDEVLQSAHSWLKESLKSDGQIAKHLSNGSLGPAFRYYGTTARDVANAPADAGLKDVYKPLGWLFLLMDENGQPVGEVVFGLAGGTWRYMWAGFGGTTAADLHAGVKTVPEKAVARGLEARNAELAVMSLHPTDLLVVSDGKAEFAMPVGRFAQGKKRLWRQGELHTSKEAVAALKDALAVKSRGADRGGYTPEGSYPIWTAAAAALVVLAGTSVLVLRRKPR